MPSEKYPPAICRSPLIDYLAGIGSHAVMILTFRHSGEELRSISSRHTAGLMAVAVGMVVACTHFAPGSSSTHSLVSCALFALLIAAALRTFGMHAVAGYATFLVVTEPVALVVRHLPMGDLIDAVFSFWCLAALSVYGGKCAKKQNGVASMKSTAEQLPIIEYQGDHLVVKAYAGCGKTTTLVAYANHHSHLRMLYLAYNRAIRDEGAEKFPKNVVCKTSHQLAWPQFGRHYQHKLGNIRLTDAAGLLKTRNWGDVRDAIAVLNAYLSSADEEISEAHYFAALSEEEAAEHGADHLDRTINSAQKLWDAMIDTESKFPCQHDAYLKLFQLSNPQLPYDVILFDEAQDSNPVTASLVAGQKARKIFVGDKWQQIYRWRGAENALDTQIVQGAASMFLTNSFRFGPMIAGVANAILKQQGEARPLVGYGARDKVTTSLPSGCNHYTVLNRTVIGVIMTAIDAVSDGQVVYWNGGIEAYQISDLEDVYHLKVGRKDEIRNKRLFGQFSDFGGFAEAAEESKDAEMNRMLRILKEHNDIPKLIAALRRNSTDDPLDADVIVSTCHRSKGLEWDVVVLEEDFPDIFDEEKITPDQRVDELNLLYVAATRAKKVLVINSITQVVIQKSHAEAKREMEAAAGQRA